MGKVISERQIPFEVFRTTMQKIWKVEGTISFSDVGANAYVLEFQSVKNLQKIKRGYPWMFDRQLIILQKFNGSVPIQEMHFKNEWFWVQLYNLPTGGMNKLVREKLGCAIGIPLVDVNEYDIGWSCHSRESFWKN